MANSNGNGDHSGLDKLSNNVYSLILARFILPGLVATVGWFAANAFGDLKDSVKETRIAVESVDHRVTVTLADFERRINAIEEQQRLLQQHR